MAPANSSRNFSAPEARNGSGEQGLRGAERTSPARRPRWGRGGGAKSFAEESPPEHPLVLLCSVDPGAARAQRGRPLPHKVGEAERRHTVVVAPPPASTPPPGLPAGASRLQHPRADSSGPRGGGTRRAGWG